MTVLPPFLAAFALAEVDDEETPEEVTELFRRSSLLFFVGGGTLV